MAITIVPKIGFQNLSGGFNVDYFYLYEPLWIRIQDTTPTGKIFVNFINFTNDGNNAVTEEIAYAEYDYSDSRGYIDIDIMKIIRELDNPDVFNYSIVEDIALTYEGDLSIISSFRYRISITNEKPFETSPAPDFSILPIKGGRDFYNFNSFDETYPVTEAQLYNLDLSGRWKGYKILEQTLNDPTSINTNFVNSTLTTETNGCKPKGGMLYWKSRLGGWMQWGMDIVELKNSKVYKGSVKQGMIGGVSPTSVRPYVSPDYTYIENMQTVQLTALSLTRDEMLAVDGINNSPAVYYQRDVGGVLELMRLTSSDTSINNLANGGDFKVSLKSISKTQFNLM